METVVRGQVTMLNCVTVRSHVNDYACSPLGGIALLTVLAT